MGGWVGRTPLHSCTEASRVCPAGGSQRLVGYSCLAADIPGGGWEVKRAYTQGDLLSRTCPIASPLRGKTKQKVTKIYRLVGARQYELMNADCGRARGLGVGNRREPGKDDPNPPLPTTRAQKTRHTVEAQWPLTPPCKTPVCAETYARWKLAGSPLSRVPA